MRTPHANEMVCGLFRMMMVSTVNNRLGTTIAQSIRVYIKAMPMIANIMSIIAERSIMGMTSIIIRREFFVQDGEMLVDKIVHDDKEYDIIFDESPESIEEYVTVDTFADECNEDLEKLSSTETCIHSTDVNVTVDVFADECSEDLEKLSGTEISIHYKDVIQIDFPQECIYQYNLRHKTASFNATASFKLSKNEVKKNCTSFVEFLIMKGSSITKSAAVPKVERRVVVQPYPFFVC